MSVNYVKWKRERDRVCVCRLCEGKGERYRLNVYVDYVKGRERGTEYVYVDYVKGT